ncbi:serine/threonine-protein kinase [Clavibacter michiganensis]|uniref:serine/threonine-protein kinase n=1 Tax=Clavibacter michiganensis TaxID=28447 RepID=UPI000A39C2F8|nr:serine/threonine-protein kinase [Clavibacter michiganensis]MDO4099201.1 serine/threonine-protein kinase [Clavibacter michiganensis]MDO4127450.1 serine/threonine-protein kinase [Clavibacter michiganensis]NIY61755.1 protein kinase [Clavibacter michiganensis subsp. michiganensis]OUE27508.1 Serine/threonine-protein kinase PrkC [Clavibacter michiganensis subsp. michiganensis]QXP02747.1 serine/threonine protein kinase [Clavibacter michiganensis subsp. michiganensis]
MPDPTPLSSEAVAAALNGQNATLLGQGTFGETWRVELVEVDGEPQTVAAKFLKPAHYNVTLAQRETAWLSRMSTHGVVRLFSVVEVDINGVQYTVLLCEYIHGGSVEDAITRAYPSHSEIMDFAAGLLECVEHVHSVNAVHRDIKPANIMLRDGDWSQPVLIDFGLAKGTGDATITQYPQPVGTIAWMAPEQLRGQEARKAADIWACGVILYQLFTAGAYPFFNPAELQGVGREEIAELVEGPPVPLPDEVSPEMRLLIAKFLSQQGWRRGSASRAAKDLKDLR